MSLPTFWFCLITVLWAGYFVLEGFDFGVGMLLPILGRSAEDKDAMLDTIGPVWDGNEVWLVTAGGATFAAFPAWYAAMFSGFYVALMLVLVLLIVRVMSFEWRQQARGYALAGRLVVGEHDREASAPADLGDRAGQPGAGSPDRLRRRLRRGRSPTCSAPSRWPRESQRWRSLRSTVPSSSSSRRSVSCAPGQPTWRTGSRPPVIGIVAVFLTWTVVVSTDTNHKSAFPAAIVAAAAVIALAIGALLASPRAAGGRAFAATAVGVILVVATIFTSLFPRVMVSNPDFQNSLTAAGAASSHYALQVMTVVAVILTPVILVYQGWTYYVFRRRLTDAPGARLPLPPEA